MIRDLELPQIVAPAVLREELDTHTSLLIGDARAAMRSMKPESVHVICTSIPYYALRSYGTDPQVWGADDPTCPHAWGEHEPPKRARWGDPSTLSAKQSSNGGSLEMIAALETPGGQFCQLCGALRCEWGSEPTVQWFVRNSVEVCAAAWEVLRDDGVFFLNIGDSWASAWPCTRRSQIGNGSPDGCPRTSRLQGGLKELDLCLVPERLAIALQDAGWLVRSRIIRYNRNPMPESIMDVRWVRCRVKVADAPRARAGTHHAEANHKPQGARDGAEFASAAKRIPCPGCSKCEATGGFVLRRGSGRPAKAHEHIWMLTKRPGNYWDCEAIRQAYSEKTLPQRGADYRGRGRKDYAGADVQNPSDVKRRTAASLEKNSGSHLKDVWPMVSQPYPGAHFATYPVRLPELCIKAATSEAGCCPECGAPWARVVDEVATGAVHKMPDNWDTGAGSHGAFHRQGREKGQVGVPVTRPSTLGWHPTCECAEQAVRAVPVDTAHSWVGATLDVVLAHSPVPCTVLDFCGGSGTTAVAARRLKRRSVLVELKVQYCGLLRERVLSEPWGGREVKAKKTRTVRRTNAGPQLALLEVA